jgi:hypothetical protein
MSSHRAEFLHFLDEYKFRGKGELCVALVITQHAKELGFPLDADQFVTVGGGQVLGLGKSAVQAILNRHGIQKVLAEEGGRTSRGSLGNMRAYVGFLNRLALAGVVDLDWVEAFWVARVQAFFAAKPFRLEMDSSKGLRSVVRSLVEQAQKRQKENAGMQYAGAVLQHLIGAKLECVLGAGSVKHHSFSTADAPSGRSGDFSLGDVVIHVTVTPGEAVIAKCVANLKEGFKPILVTLAKKLAAADSLAEDAGVGDRIDIFEVEQFVALNLYEIGKFVDGGRRVAVTDLIQRYNEIVQAVETDPSLRIDLK